VREQRGEIETREAIMKKKKPNQKAREGKHSRVRDEVPARRGDLDRKAIERQK